MIDFDALINAATQDAFGQPVLYTPVGTQTAIQISGIFQRGYQETTFSTEGVPVANRLPVLTVRQVSFPAGIVPQQGDTLVVGGCSYQVTNPGARRRRNHLPQAQGDEAMSGTLPTNGRAAVRDQIAAIVEAAVEPLGGVVFRARIFPLQLPQLPAVLVYGWKEKKTLASLSSADPRYDVTCHYDVHAVTGADTPELLEVALEALAVSITEAVLQAPGLVDNGGTIERIASVETTIACRTSRLSSLPERFTWFSSANGARLTTCRCPSGPAAPTARRSISGSPATQCRLADAES